MPFIHVKSLPFQPPLEIDTVLEQLTVAFSIGAGVELKHVTATWDWLHPGHYAVGGRVAHHQPQDSHPVLVDLLVPDFYPPERVEKMLLAIPLSIAKLTNLTSNNVFVNCRRASAGAVVDGGELLRW